MGISRRLALVALAAGTLCALEQPFREYPGVEYNDWRLPADWNQKSEWTFARLMFPPGPLDGYYPRFQGDYRLGLSLWTQDYPKADRLFALAVRRLSRVDARSVEQVINIEDPNEVFDWPWLYAVQTGEWGLTQHQGAILREYLQRGGFFMPDDFHGEDEYGEFEKRIHFAFPGAAIDEIPNDDPIFHTVFDLNDRIQVPGAAHLGAGYKNGGRVPHWLAIRDDKGRILVAASYNSDIGDGWEYADIPWYPERMSNSAIRIGVNYVIYAMTH